MDSVRARILFADNFSEFATEQGRCLILVPRNECTTVFALKEYIRNKFSFGRELNFGLSIDGYVLPGWEKSEIIRENDTLCVFMESSYSVQTDSSAASSSHPDTKTESKSKKKRKSEQEAARSEMEPVTKKAKKAKLKKIEKPPKEDDKKKQKDKDETNKLMKGKKDETNKLKKRKKVDQLSQEGHNETNTEKGSVENFSKPIHSVTNEQTVVQEDGEDDEGSDEEETSKTAKEESGRLLEGEDKDVKDGTGDASQNKSLLSQNEKMLGSQERPLENNSKDGVATKKRRRRKRKKKGKPNVVGDESNKTNKDAQLEQSKPGLVNGTITAHVATNDNVQNVGLSNPSQRDEVFENKHSSGHIVFDSDGDGDNQSKKPDAQKDILENCPDRSTIPAVINSSEKVGEGEGNGDQILTSQQQMAKTNEDEGGEKVKQIINPTAKDYNAYATLDGPPRKGDIIAFKTLELSSDYTPEVSEFKEGVVTNYDHKTKQVEVQLTVAPGTGEKEQGEDTKDGRFEMEMDEEWTTDRLKEQEATLISTSLPCLLELKLIT